MILWIRLLGRKSEAGRYGAHSEDVPKRGRGAEETWLPQFSTWAKPENSGPLSPVMLLKTCENVSPNASLRSCVAFSTESRFLPRRWRAT